MFLQFTDRNLKAQGHLLGGLGRLVGDVHPIALLPKVSNVLKSLYDHDIHDEEVLRTPEGTGALGCTTWMSYLGVYCNGFEDGR